MPDIQLLDNPMWNALTTSQSQFAVGDGLARAYFSEIGPLSGLVEQSPDAYEHLRALTEPGGVKVLFLDEPPIQRAGWTLIRGGILDQMVHSGSSIGELPQIDGMRSLAVTDVPAMIELAKLTDPGPFRERTHELGTFFGIFESDRLLAMAGQRMRVPGFVEVSTVCTHPDARGRGFARVLMSAVMRLIVSEGDTPFLHTLADNHSAIRVYKALGFTRRRSFHLAVLKKDA
jgi:ribosomal protein S18 acetylase RimI-like enzyme